MKPAQLPIINLVVLLLLLIVGGVAMFETIGQLKVTNLAQARVNSLNQGVDRLSSLTNALPEIKPTVDSWQEALPSDEQDVALFAANVESIADVNNMVVSLNFADFPVISVVSGQKFDGLSTDILLEGSYQGLIGFIRGMSAAPYFYKIDKLAINKNQSKSGLKVTINGTLMMNLNK